METYGELKKAINAIKLKQKGTKVGNLAIDVALDMIPGIGAAKTTFDFIKAAFLKPDTKKTQTWLDKLDIDDEMSSIIDDTVENGFLRSISATIESESDDKPLELDFNMNAKMVDYLKDKYSGRTVTGITEKKMKYRLPKKIKEVEVEDKISGNVTAILKDLADQSGNFKAITSTVKMLELLDGIVTKVKESNPEFVEGSQFKVAVKDFYFKYK